MRSVPVLIAVGALLAVPFLGSAAAQPNPGSRAGVQVGPSLTIFDWVPSARQHGPGQFIAVSLQPSRTATGLAVSGMMCTDRGPGGDPVCRIVDGAFAGTIRSESGGRMSLRIDGTPLGPIRLTATKLPNQQPAAHTCSLSDTGSIDMTMPKPSASLRWTGTIAGQPYVTSAGCNQQLDTGMTWVASPSS